MPRSDLVSLIIRLAIGLVILAIIGWLLYSRLRGPKTTNNPDPNTSSTPVVIITDDPAPTIIPSPSLPEVGDSYNGTPSGTADHRNYGSRYYSAPRTTTYRTHHTHGTTYTTTTYYTTGQTTTSTSTSTGGSAQASASASASAGNAHASSSASAGSASASASANASSR